ncbi:lactate utilization protein B [Actinacidiphila paucisporea]|uniref:L-lactate dehydrogenase complex protein LldF n=1 Tax=Actinacidiphila paucisporea TaxID=310782 RepID=A0A1M7AXE2_9ACTN|nr:lactate utilization protein B [Actinacidiphila paucisporea]SHL47385.1 L-lactate dehydrogenase complex protein LldF [Actinacidiphila paucisporea]
MSRTHLGLPTFPQAARLSTRDEQLRANLRHATSTIRTKRATATSELSDWPQLRAAGAAIKDHTLHHLDHYLEQLETAVTTAGGTVHWAIDADDANRIITDLIHATGESEVVKVKSMATQETGLNEALTQAGITAYETDLAELIVQLDNDRPSHILVPAIHKNRTQIRDIFHTRMGAWGRPAPDDLTDTPADLAEAARLHLREKFLRTKVAISGANFMIAETGTMVVLESEGNGRMCLTLPDTLITLVGIEKTIPTWRDLEVFLQTLPRSSTAERMNPYTTTWTGTTLGDGPQTFHLVLLDNGRTDTLADTTGRQALRCIRCSACLNVCPVYERAGGHAYGTPYPGPIGAILTPQLHGTTTPLNASLPYASTLCGACYDVCPVAINIPEVLVHLRERITQGGPTTTNGTKTTIKPAKRHTTERTTMRTAAWTLNHPAAWTATQRLTTRTRALHPRRLPGKTARAWTATRDLPPVPARTFRDWWQHRDADAKDTPQ